jgi:hypothetical protein
LGAAAASDLVLTAASTLDCGASLSPRLGSSCPASRSPLCRVALASWHAAASEQANSAGAMTRVVSKSIGM